MFKKNAAPTPSIDYLTAPMAEDELAYVSDHSEDGTVKVIVPVSIDEIAENDFEGFMDLLTCRVCGDNGLLSDICYVPVGVDADTNEILVEVTAFWDNMG